MQPTVIPDTIGAAKLLVNGIDCFLFKFCDAALCSNIYFSFTFKEGIVIDRYFSEISFKIHYSFIIERNYRRSNRGIVWIKSSIAGLALIAEVLSFQV
jgi:hypothetical protein